MSNDEQKTHSITDLRAHLFDTLAALRDKEAPMDIDRARAVSEVAKVIVDSAKVEVEYLRATGGGESSFIETRAEDNKPLPPGITGRTVHRIGG